MTADLQLLLGTLCKKPVLSALPLHLNLRRCKGGGAAAMICHQVMQRRESQLVWILRPDGITWA